MSLDFFRKTWLASVDEQLLLQRQFVLYSLKELLTFVKLHVSTCLHHLDPFSKNIVYIYIINYNNLYISISNQFDHDVSSAPRLVRGQEPLQKAPSHLRQLRFFPAEKKNCV